MYSGDMQAWGCQNLQNFKKLLEFGNGNVPKRPMPCIPPRAFCFFVAGESEGLDE